MRDARSELGFRPLYQQVRARLTRFIADGTWQSGQLIPSETQIAQDLGVSQGTVRKALDDMRAANLLIRQQGRGTFVARHDEARILFQFFKLVPDSGPATFPESAVQSVTRQLASAHEQRVLGLETEDEVIRIERIRSMAGSPVIVETIAVPANRFRGLDMMTVPNNLYALYADLFGVVVTAARERVKALAATEPDAIALNIPPGAPVLLIDRIAIALDGSAVEWRVSRCNTAHTSYVTELT